MNPYQYKLDCALPPLLNHPPAQQLLPTPQVEEIAAIKLPDLNCETLEAAVATVMGTARNMGITVEAA